MASKLSLFLAELKRRKVYHVAVAYLAIGVGMVYGVPDLFATFDLSQSAARIVIILIAIGFPIALVLAWAYEVRPEEPREPGRTPPAPEEMSNPAPDRKSIVVLPFDNMSPDPGDAYFADGLTEEITTDLSHLHSLRVISRSSAMALKGMDKDVRAIGRELNVQYVLEGSVRKAGDDLRITAQLIDATSDEHLWAEKYDGGLEDVFGMQEFVARSIVDTLQLQLEAGEARRLGEHPIQDLKAYECYLRATQEVLQFTKESMDRAIAYLEQASEIVGEKAVILAGLAYVHVQLANIGEDLEESYRKAEDFAKRALSLDPDCAQAHMVLGSLLLLQRNLRGGLFHLERALESNPHDPTTLLWMAHGYSVVGMYDEFRSALQRAMKADPLSPLYQSLPGYVATLEGRFDDAVGFYRELHRVEPDNPIAIQQWALALAWGQRLEEAHKLLDEKVSESATNAFSRFPLLLKYAIEGDREKMGGLVQGDFEKTLRSDTQFTFFTASVYALAGPKDLALDWVEYAIEAGFANYPWLAEIDPFMAPYREDPRFLELLKRVKAEWESYRN